MDDRFSRSVSLIGEANFNKIKNMKIAIFGLGGVGGYTLEALARSGVSSFLLVDKDKVDITNINRQVIALDNTINQSKCSAWEKRLLAINPSIDVEYKEMFYALDNKDEIDLSKYDYVVDAIDTISSKLVLIEECLVKGVKIISSMGAGNRLDPSKVIITDIFKTSNDPLAKVMRHELRKRNIKHLKVACSTELPIEPVSKIQEERRKDTPSSMVFVPAAMGLAIAREIVISFIHE